MADVSRKISRSKERLQTKQSNIQQFEGEINDSDNIMSEVNTIKNLIWKDLDEEQIISLIPLTPKELESKVAQLFSFHKYHICLKEACLVDFYVSAFWFAKDSKFTTEQISAFFSLVKILLESIRAQLGQTCDQIKEQCICAENIRIKPKDEKMSMGKNICQMKRFMGTSSSSDRSSVFSIYQTKLISDYITDSLFQHYKLYKLLFSSKPTDEPVIKQKLLVEVPPMADVPFPPPLDEGLPEEIHSEHVLGLKKSNVNVAENDTKEVHPEINTQDDILVKNEEIVNENCEQTQETLLSSLSPGQMKQVLKDVSDGILNEVKNTVQKKLKERESTILTRMSKK